MPCGHKRQHPDQYKNKWNPGARFWLPWREQQGAAKAAGGAKHAAGKQGAKQGKGGKAFHAPLFYQ